MKLFSVLVIYVLIWKSSSQSITVHNDAATLNIELQSGSLQLTLQEGNEIKLNGSIGLNLQNYSAPTPCQGVSNCVEFENGTVRLHVLTDIDNAFTVYWISEDASKVFEDCFELANLNWYGGPERFQQAWPIEKLNLTNFANVLQEDQWGAVVEPYWLNSAGAYVFVNEKVPLFVNQNSSSYATSKNRVCFSAKVADPYPQRNKVVLHYTVASARNAKDAHLHAVRHFLGHPSGHPNYKILERPVWSTWVRYKRDVNDSAVLEFAKDIVHNGYPDGQFEIDDNWEECYGALVFNLSRFGDINNTVAEIKRMGFRVTLWTHPFVNLDCTKYSEIGRRYGYFAKNAEGNDLTKWWNSVQDDAHYLDFTKPEVRLWFVERLRNIQKNHGIDSFKFDAGESSWAPQIPVLNGDVDEQPNNIGADYARTCATFGDLVEVRVGWKTQDLPVLVRMIDKDSNWGILNGLYTLITTLLQMNMNGYTLVLPDMVGGNGYYGTPSGELFVRWLQANVFMPVIQFSYVPWDYDNQGLNFDVGAISRRMVNLHQRIAPYIERVMKNSVERGHPVNAPIWWVSPDDPAAHKEDTEYLLGEDVLVAPVITEGAVARDVYLPRGKWVDGNNGTVHHGPVLLRNYSAPIEVLPYFVRLHSEAHKLLGRPHKVSVSLE